MIYPDFVNVLFPIDISYGASSSSRWKTDIVMVESGFEKRNANWQDSLLEFNVTHNIKTEEQAIMLKKLYQQMRGPLISFKFKDWTDYTVNLEEGIANEDGKFNGMPNVELWYKYEYTTDFLYYAKKINLIIPDQDCDYFPFACFIDGIQQPQSSYELDEINGVVKFAPIKQANIVSITKESNAIVTTTSPHNFTNIDKIYLDNVVNMNFLNKRLFNITVIDSTHFYLNTSTLNAVVQGTNGTASFYRQDNAIFTWQGEFYCNVRFSEDIATLTIDDYRSFSFPSKLTELRYQGTL